jgi:hypothetical protein
MNIKINVADITCKIESNEEVINLLKENCKDFLTTDQEDFFININLKEKVDIKEVVTKNGKVIELKERRENIFDKKNYYLITCNLFNGKLFINENKADFDVKNNEKYLWLIVRNLLRACYSLIMFHNNGFLMHGSCIVDNNKGYLFCGKATYGKSTVAKMSNRKVLSDESVIIRNLDNKKIAYGTPFGGELEPLNETAILEKIFFLIKDNTTYFEELTIIRKLPEFIQNEFLGFTLAFENNEELNKRLFKNSLTFLKDIKCYNMHFKLEENLINKVIEVD